ncbi:uncharacterized protein AB675_3221 [Cyphellophora attinorum]|uniref:F-box domain-containing protein n=1 Tax=Cyphellophora attinorum TaxID=1664694 RepID=A0A0N1H5W0_9EURO|nr:uncharacterized protein AB675_3221 [Phialophora attinorum]KPI37910.1 hypothetical protein AB675_3221 [Phialophora attinorum]
MGLLSLSDELLLIVISETDPLDGLVPLTETCRRLHEISRGRLREHRALIEEFTIACLDIHCDHSQHHPRFDCRGAARTKRKRRPACKSRAHGNRSFMDRGPSHLLLRIHDQPEVAQYIKCILLPFRPVSEQRGIVETYMEDFRKGKVRDGHARALWRTQGFADLYATALGLEVTGDFADDADELLTSRLFDTIEERRPRRRYSEARSLHTIPYSAAIHFFHLLYLLVSLCPNLECLRFHDSEQVEAFLRVCERWDDDAHDRPKNKPPHGPLQQPRQPLRSMGRAGMSLQIGPFKQLKFLFPAFMPRDRQSEENFIGAGAAAARKIDAAFLFKGRRPPRNIQALQDEVQRTEMETLIQAIVLDQASKGIPSKAE